MASLGISLGTAAAGVLGAAYLDAKHSISEDLNRAVALIKAKRLLKAGDKQDKNSAFYIFENQAIKNPKKECLSCQGKSLTYEEVNLGESVASGLPHPPPGLGSSWDVPEMDHPPSSRLMTVG